MNRIRLFTSASVLEAAETFVKKLVDRLGEKNMSLDQIRSVTLEQRADPLNDFAQKYRSEFAPSTRERLGDADKPRGSSSTNSL